MYYSDERVMDYYSRRYSGFRKIVSLTNSRVAKREKWLDIGCGPGALLEVAKERGWQVYGLDPSEICVEVARRRLGNTSVTLGTVEERLPGFHGVTVASFMNVLRCIEQVGLVVGTLRKVLVGGGWVVIRETNANVGRRKRWREKQRVEVGPTTPLQLWTPRSLEKALRIAGFRNVQSIPSPTFTETLQSERDGEVGCRNEIERLVKWGAWPALRLVHAASRGRVCLGPNFVTFGQN